MTPRWAPPMNRLHIKSPPPGAFPASLYSIFAYSTIRAHSSRGSLYRCGETLKAPIPHVSRGRGSCAHVFSLEEPICTPRADHVAFRFLYEPAKKIFHFVIPACICTTQQPKRSKTVNQRTSSMPPGLFGAGRDEMRCGMRRKKMMVCCMAVSENEIRYPMHITLASNSRVCRGTS